MTLLGTVEKEINGKKFILSKFPAVAGREIISKYRTAGFPDITDYKVSEDTMLKLMGYVAVPITGSNPLPLTTLALVNNHAGDWATLMKIEGEMLSYNSSFLPEG
jgi:hypothetical protein